MRFQLVILTCLVTVGLAAASRFGISRGKYGGFGGHAGYNSYGGHGHLHSYPAHGGHRGHCDYYHQFPSYGHHHRHDYRYSRDHKAPNFPVDYDHKHQEEHEKTPTPADHDLKHFQEHQEPPPSDDQDHRQPLQANKPLSPIDHDNRHSKKLKHPQQSNITVHFIVHEPKGLEAWIIQQKDMVFFGIELYVNKEPSKAKDMCDVCANTTEITNGKFIIEDPDVVVKNGDVLHYHVLVGEGRRIVRQKLQVLVVNETIISKCNCQESSDILDIDIRFDKQEHRSARREHFSEDPQSDTRILEHIVEYLKTICIAQPTNKLKLLKQAPVKATGENELENFVKSYFAVSGELRELGRGIREVNSLNEQGIEFEMDSYVNKQRVLYYVRENVLKQIVDPDLTSEGY